MYALGHEEVPALGPAILLVHGFNGGPGDMRELEEHLRAEGFSTRNLLLPGHGRGARDLARTTWSDWTNAVLDAVSELKERHTTVVLVGHSMGAALALHAAAKMPELAGVVALCPPLRMFFGEARVAALVRRVAPYVPSLREDIYDPEARRQYRRFGSHWTPLEAAHSLLSALPALRTQLGSVTCPALVMCARKDHVVPMRDGIEVFNMLGTSAKELHVLQRSYHVVTKDVEREIVARKVMEFAKRVTGHGTLLHASVQRDLAGEGLPVPGMARRRKRPTIGLHQLAKTLIRPGITRAMQRRVRPEVSACPARTASALESSNTSSGARARSVAHLISFMWRVWVGRGGIGAGRFSR